MIAFGGQRRHEDLFRFFFEERDDVRGGEAQASPSRKTAPMLAIFPASEWDIPKRQPERP
jgi:hypothetical protein